MLGAVLCSQYNRSLTNEADVLPTIQPASGAGVEWVTALERYTDQDVGFQMAVPSGWGRIVLDQAESSVDALDIGYAVGFEAPQQSLTDEFADYILVEVLPGTDSGLFDAGSEQRYSLQIDGNSIEYDRLYIDSKADKHAAVDLVIFQREFRALGYTVDFYAIGEPANEKTLFDAFQIMLRTFEINAAPFKIS